MTIGFLGMALIPGLLFLVAAALRRDRWGWTRRAAVVWFLFAVWEALIQYQVICDAECNIRADLLLIFPIVVVSSMLGAWRAVQARNDRSHRGVRSE